VFNGLDLKKVAELEIPCGICLKELVQERGKIHQWLFPMTQRERKQKLTTRKLEKIMGWMLAPDSSLFQSQALLKMADCSISSL